ncbi:MAG: translocation/assembly module TamB [Prevotella sp.]|jgi:hypothetical protein|nr:translocation/assembly module TamB [Prevotella sp.]
MIVLLFGLLNTPAVQEYAKNIIVDELKGKLGTELGIGKLSFQPFNTIALDSVYLYDQSNKQVLLAERISAGINIFSLLQGDIVITSAWLNNFELHLSKETKEAPLNIQYVLDAFKSQDEKPKSKINFVVNSLNISDGTFYYDIGDQFQKDIGFDPNHILVSDFNAKLALKSLDSDSLNIQIKKIELKEKSGFEVSDLSFRLISQGKKYSVKGFDLSLPSSNLSFNKLDLDLTPINDTANILDYATLDCIIAPSNILPKDISAFIPALSNFDELLIFQGKFSGNINDFSAKDLSFRNGESLSLLANIEIKDIREKDKTYILGSINELIVDSQVAETFINDFSEKKIVLPKQLKKLGRVSFEGDISGFLNQLTAFGSLETALGIVKTDILFGFNSRKNIEMYAKGNISASGFKLGELLDNNDLDKISLHLSVDMEKPIHQKIRGTAEGEISDFDFNSYTYDNIAINVEYDGLKIDGSLDLNDPNGNVTLAGLFDLSDKDNPEVNFAARVKDVQLGNLNLVKNLDYSYLSFNIDADFVGKDIDNAEGYINIDSIDFIRDDKVFIMSQFLIEIAGLAGEKKLSLESDIINGNISGSVAFSSIADNIQQTFRMYLPSLIAPNKKKTPEDKDNIFNFDFTVNKTDSLSDIFKLPVTLFDQTRIKGNYDNITDKFNLDVSTSALKAAGMNLKDVHVVINNPDDAIIANIKTSIMGKKESVNEIAINSSAKENLVNTKISLINKGFQKADGEFYISTLFDREEAESPLHIDVNVNPSKLLLNNAYWEMTKSHIHIQEGIYAIDNFHVYNENGDQEIKINGKYSTKNTNDILKAELKKIDLQYIFETLAIDALQFGGLASGNLFVSTIESKPYANTRLDVTGFKFNGTDLGELNIFSEFEEATKEVILEGLIVSKEKKETKVNGRIDPVKQGLSIYFDADSVDMSFLNKYAQVLFDDIKGRGTGNVHLFGNFSDVTVEGKAFVQDGNLGINFLNTRYSFTDTVFMKKDLIYFNNLKLTDQHNNIASVNGKISHDYFRDFAYVVDLSANNFLLYSATQQQNPIFYGKVFGSGNGTVSGDESKVDIDIRMRTEDKTVVQMNFMEDYINEYSFITYKQKDTIQTETSLIVPPIQINSEIAINMNFYIDATPDAIVEIVMDPVGGDVLRGSGSGAMQFQWMSGASPRLFGTYNIARGSYNFTFQRIMERRFMIQEGSNVQFRGDPFEALLDVDAIYKINASLYDLDQNLAQSTGLSTIPVNCVLNLTGALRHPNVGLDITFPSADSEVARQLKSLINTEDEINKQVASLLILSKFRAPQDANVENPTSDFAAMASATLSNQLTKLVSQIDNRWQLGTNIRYSDREMTYTEAELLLSSQLLNDRLLINGNFGYRRNDLNSMGNIDKEVMITDVDIEYLLNNAGTWRIKAYNHYNEKFYYTGNATQTQGVGIIYKKDFDELYELFHRPRPRFTLPSDTIRPIVPDSLEKGSPLSHFIKLKK